MGRGRGKGRMMEAGEEDEPGVFGYIGGQGKRPAVWSDPTFALWTHRVRVGSLLAPVLRAESARERCIPSLSTTHGAVRKRPSARHTDIARGRAGR